MKRTIPLILALLLCAPAIAEAPKDLGIAAIVGEEAVTSYDVTNRLKFVIVTAHLSDTPDVIERVRPQIVRSLIDEHLQLQEAAKNDIKISDEEVTRAIASIEQQRGMPDGTIFHLLDENHIPHDTFTNQIRAQLAWSQLLHRKIRPLVKVSDNEIALASKDASLLPALAPAAASTPAAPPPTASPNQQLQIAVISIPIDKKSREKEIARLAEKLVSEMHRGASFEEVSRQFSSGNASSGGKVETFWVKLHQLDPAIARALGNAHAGTITQPVHTSEGYTIVKVYNVKGGDSKTAKATKAAPPVAAAVPAEPDPEVYLKEILLKLKPDAGSKEANVMLQIGEEVSKHPGTCEEKGIASVKDLDDFDIDVNYRRSLLSQLPPAIKIIAENLKVGDISTPFASDDGIRLYMMCDKKSMIAATADRDRLYAMLAQQKMNLEAQKYLRNLRRETYIEVR